MIDTKNGIEEYLKTKPLLKLNLACGLLKIDDYVGIDILENSIADIKLDLMEFPWPIESNSVQEIFCSHYIEHIPHTLKIENDGLFKFMDECYRILKIGGELKIVSPYYTSIRAVQDPTHHRMINESMFCYFSKEWRVNSGIGHYPFNCDFKFTYGLDYEDDMKLKSEEFLKFASRHYMNVIRDIHVSLIKI